VEHLGPVGVGHLLQRLWHYREFAAVASSSADSGRPESAAGKKTYEDARLSYELAVDATAVSK